MAFKPNVTGGGGGGAEGALLAVNNLSDVPNDAAARANIGAGTGDGDMLAANNLSEVDPAQARTNIGAGTGDGDMLASNNLSEVDPATARANIGAGTGDGDMLGSNNLSELTDTNQAKTNLGVDFYPNNEVLKFGRNIVSPTMRIGTVANPDGSLVTRIQYQNDGDGLVNHLQIGTNDSVFDNFDPAYTTNNFSDIPGVILRSNDPNVNLGLFPRLTNGNQSFMLTGPAGIRVVADTAGGPGVMQLGQGGASAVLNLSGNSGQNNRVVCANGTGHSLYLTRTVGAAIVKASDATAPPAPFYTTCGHVVPNTILANTDYELDANDYLITYVQLDAPFTLTIPKLINLLGNSNTGTPLTDRTFIFVIKDGTGNASVNPVTIQSLEGLPFDGAPNYSLNRDYGSVTLMVCAVNNFAKILVINEN